MKKIIRKTAIASAAIAALMAISLPSYAHTVIRFNFGFYNPGHHSSYSEHYYYSDDGYHYHHHWCRWHDCGPRWHYRYHRGHWRYHHSYWSRRWY
ncbi:MAG: hypothetical protein K0U12_05960 [Gammaproteobacteria bacterium]|nr:hypothetical protein [Gammaproteobacteria bacterium]